MGAIYIERVTVMHVPPRVDCWTRTVPDHGHCKAFRDQEQMALINGHACFRDGVPCARLKLEKESA